MAATMAASHEWAMFSWKSCVDVLYRAGHIVQGHFERLGRHPLTPTAPHGSKCSRQPGSNDFRFAQRGLAQVRAEAAAQSVECGKVLRPIQASRHKSFGILNAKIRQA